MWVNRVNFGIIFTISIFLSYQNFVECDVDCHENLSKQINVAFTFAVNKYRDEHQAQKLFHTNEDQFYEWVLRKAKNFASSGTMMKDDLGDVPIFPYLKTFGHVEGILFNNNGEDVAKDIVRRWYEEKNNYNSHSYSPEIANFTRMLWNATDWIDCSICSKDSNSHYIVCIYKRHNKTDGYDDSIPYMNRDPTPEQFKKNVFFINDDPITLLTSTYKIIGEETTIDYAESSNSYRNTSSTVYPLMKILLNGTLDIRATGVIPTHRR